MTFYINAISLTDAYLLDRTSKDSWSTFKKGAARFPFVERTAQEPTSYSVELKFLGSERYNVATSIEAEFDHCESVLLRNDASKKMYGTDEWLWLDHAEFEIEEEGGHRLIAKVSGQINPYVVHTCDFTTNWSSGHTDGGSAGTVSNTTPHDGHYCLQLAKSSPLEDGYYWMNYTPADTLDLTDRSYIGFWIKCSKLSAYFNQFRIRLGSDASNHEYWDIAVTGTNTWQYKEIDLTDSDGETGSCDQTAIADIRFIVQMKDGTDDWNLYVDTIKTRGSGGDSR